MTDHRIASLLMPGRVVASADSKSVLGLSVQIGPYELRDNVPQFGLHGIISHPLPGADVVVAHHAGDRAQPVVVGVNDQIRRKKNSRPGDVGLAHHLGHFAVLTPDGILVDGHGLPVIIQNASLVTVKGNVRIEGTLTVTEDVTAHADGAAVHLTTHTHTDPQGGTVGTPTG